MENLTRDRVTTIPALEPIPFLNLAYQHDRIAEAVNEAFTKVFSRNWFILGSEVSAFETEYATYSGAPHCIGVGNGLDALTLSLMAGGIGRGDEVIVPAHTYLATWLAVTRTGAIPVPVDADPATFNLNVSKIAERITPRTKAILPVHLYGQPCNMTQIDELSRQFNLPVIEDNAQAHGAMWREKKTGTFGAINATSFYPTKNLGALGDGGAVTAFDPKKADFVRRMRNYGLIDKSHLSALGLNSRLDEMQAAFLRIKLRYLDAWNDERRHLAGLYLDLLHNVGDLILPLADKECVHVYHLFVIQSRFRDKLRMHLKNDGIETLIHYPIPPHLQHAFLELNYREGDFPQTERIASSVMSLPLWPGMKNEEVERVVGSIRKFFSTL